MKFSIEGRNTKRGAYTNAIVIGPCGEHWPDHTESSKTGRHWTSRWDDVSDCLVLVEDYTNSGKDHSYVHQELEDFAPIQSAALERFKTKHGLD